MNNIVMNITITSDFCYFCSIATNDFYWECSRCNKIICEECSHREDVGEKCLGEYDTHKCLMNFVSHFYEECNLCRRILADMTDEDTSVWYSKFDFEHENCINCCKLCSLSDDGRSFIEKNCLEPIDSPKTDLWSKTGVGSINDWTPIIEDSEGNMILFNRNADVPVSYACLLKNYPELRQISCYLLDQEWQIEKIVDSVSSIKQLVKSLYA